MGWNNPTHHNSI